MSVGSKLHYLVAQANPSCSLQGGKPFTYAPDQFPLRLHYLRISEDIALMPGQNPRREEVVAGKVTLQNVYAYLQSALDSLFCHPLHVI